MLLAPLEVVLDVPPEVTDPKKVYQGQVVLVMEKVRLQSILCIPQSQLKPISGIKVEKVKSKMFLLQLHAIHEWSGSL